MKIYWQLDMRYGSGWKKFAGGDAQSTNYGHGWKFVAEAITLRQPLDKIANWRWIDSRFCIWPTGLTASERNLDNLLYAEYGDASDERDIDRNFRAMLTELHRWGALERSGHHEDIGGDIWSIVPVGRIGSQYTSDQLTTAIQAFRDGWLTARGIQHSLLGGNAATTEFDPTELKEITGQREDSDYSHALQRIRAAGGEIAARLEAEFEMSKASYPEPVGNDYTAVQEHHAAFSKFVMDLAAELDKKES